MSESQESSCLYVVTQEEMIVNEACFGPHSCVKAAVGMLNVSFLTTIVRFTSETPRTKDGASSGLSEAVRGATFACK
jgi:hypothetical protein